MAAQYELVVNDAGMRLGMPQAACSPEQFCKLAGALAEQLGFAKGHRVLTQAVPGTSTSSGTGTGTDSTETGTDSCTISGAAATATTGTDVAKDISACEMGEAEKAIELTAEMQQRLNQVACDAGGAEDRCFFDIAVGSITADLISACEKGEIDEAMELFAGLQRGGLVDVITYTALIRACEKGHKVEKALELFAVMQQTGLAPTVEIYTALISACEKSDKIEKAVELLAEVQQRGLIPSGNLSHKVEKALELYVETQPRPDVHIIACEGIEVEQAMELGAEMQPRGLPPEEQAMEACQALNSACEKGDKDREPEVTTYNSVSVLGRMGQVGEATELTVEMQHRLHMYTSLISACGKFNDVDKAMELYTEMQQEDIGPDVNTYIALISACEKGHKEEKALELYGEMQQKDLVPDVGTHTALIKACQESHKVEKACELFAEMQQRGLVPCVDTYNALISACVKGNKMEKAWDQLAELIGVGTFIALVRACEKTEATHTALSVLVRKAASRGGDEFAAVQRAYMSMSPREAHEPASTLHSL